MVRQMRSALWLLVLAGPALGGEPVSLSVADETPCVKESSLVAQLERAGLSVGPAGVLDLDVSGNADGVRLRARRTRDARLLVRTVPVRRGCDGVELAVVTLIQEWARDATLPLALGPTPAQGVDAGVSAPTVKPAKRDAGAPAVPSVDAGVELVPVELPPAEPPVPDQPLPSDQPSTVDQLDAGLVTSAPDAGPLTPTPLPLAGEGALVVTVRVALGAGVSALVETPVTPSGTLVADLGLGLFGVSLDGILDGNATLSADPGTLTFGSQSLTLSARARATFGRVSADLGLGVRGVRLVATSAGFTTNGSQVLLSLGPAVTATMWVHLLGPLLLMVRASGALRLPSDQLIVDGGPTFTLGIWQLGVVAGLSIAWP